MTRPWLLALLLSIPACAVDAGDDSPDTGQAEQEVSWTQIQTFSATTSGLHTWDNVAPNSAACFLAGIDGNFQATDSTELLMGVQSGSPGQQVTIWNNANHPVSVTIACVMNVTNKHENILWRQTFGDVWYSGTASTSCFLSSIGAANHGLNAYSDGIAIDQGFGNNWRMHGASGGFMDARMICFDGPLNQGIWGGAWNAPGSTGGPLASNAAGGVACGLTGVGGQFSFNSLSSGVKITYDSLNTIWRWTLSDFKHGQVECIK